MKAKESVSQEVLDAYTECAGIANAHIADNKRQSELIDSIAGAILAARRQAEEKGK